MRRRASKASVAGSAEHHDSHGVLDDLVEEPVEFSLADDLREDILHGRRRRPMKNLSLKIDPLQEQAIRKLATMRAVPFQTLIRQWLVERLASELKP